MPDRSRRILAVASGGGHLKQLILLQPAFSGHIVVYATTNPSQAEALLPEPIVGIADYSQSVPHRVFFGVFETFSLVLKHRPDVVVSTGAAPGLLCLFWGRLLGAKTIWIESIANAERLSLSGRIALRFSHVVITQWEHLADGKRTRYIGSVI
ncbi:hypothetical protein GH983_24030 (plasmid) [Agrobacterium sp. MA01]|uniref:hypothetical protein n=1 Tax=Agrobacterium sp. MA01 TaxID=2664893 RepID=UPI00129BE1C8|nr:hypothetical protein [Agrobacterium sp. MA01]QGG93583.1 hypothetical protein GH983_24030 [Agrobacterium sp. MA01]